MKTIDVNWLKAFEIFKDVSANQLQWFIAHGEITELKDGEVLFGPGDALTGTCLIVEGKIALFDPRNSVRTEIREFTKGDVTGYLPFSRGKVAQIIAKAKGITQVFIFPISNIPEMIRSQYELTQALVIVMSNRVRDSTTLMQQNEKMMALGKLSAGLAHELNNPASAIARDSVSLKKHLHSTPQAFKDVISIQMDVKDVDLVNEVLFNKLNKPTIAPLTLKQRSALENEFEDWLDDKNISNGYELTENLVDFNFTIADMDTFAKQIPAAFLSPVLNWMNNIMVTEKMVDNIQEASVRIAELVSSVKNFTHMDRGRDKELTDIRFGIANTLKMLGYKLRKNNITLVENFDETLPQVMAYVGELNQVWTNLIDNALDAMEVNGKGTLTISSKKDEEFAQVIITDDGPGIPADVKDQIFDPFFTTKGIGKGTGMGLEVVQRIVHQHNGSVKVKSQPGNTAFTVCFPISG